MVQLDIRVVYNCLHFDYALLSLSHYGGHPTTLLFPAKCTTSGFAFNSINCSLPTKCCTGFTRPPLSLGVLRVWLARLTIPYVILMMRKNRIFNNTTMPTPSTTIPIATPAPLSSRLKSGNVISLTIGEGSHTHGMKCVPSPGCTPLPCDIHTCTGASTAENNQFYIINQNRSVNRILSGATVLLRSVNTLSHWLDCSNPASCNISMCREDNVENRFSANYVSSCSSHQVQVFGVGRQLNQLLSVQHKLKFRHKTQQSYLSCNGKRCRLLVEGNCQTRPVFPIERINGMCPIEIFSVDNLAEYYITVR